MNGVSATEMPKYLCHKEVWALKIARVEQRVGGGCFLHFDLSDTYSPRTMEKDYVEKHKPVAGGYYVQYKDGYESFSPADAFETGYTLIT